jgi:oligoendopeptidase F
LMSQMSQTEQFDYRLWRLNNLINTIHRQISCYQFERVIHDEYRSSGYLSTQRLQELFSSCMSDACGPVVNCAGGYGNRWIYWSHIRTYFYVYAYAGGALIAHSLHQLLANKTISMDDIKQSFAAWGSKSPQEIFAQMGLDISNPSFRAQGLDLIDQELRRCEQYAQDHHLI